MEEGIFPSAKVLEEGADALEEERRLCYVGMTRAKKELYLTYACSRLQFGQKSYNLPSRFLEDSEIIGNLGEESDKFQICNGPIEQIEFKIGDRVRSAAFGIGTVTEIDGEIVSVKFDTGYQKKLNVEFAHLEKDSN